MQTTNDRRRKKLIVPDEHFFAAVSLAYGAPDPAARTFFHNRFERGVGAYLRNDKRGQIFLNMVETFGEAKCRAGKLYYQYCKWYKEQRYEDNKRSQTQEAHRSG